MSHNEELLAGQDCRWGIHSCKDARSSMIMLVRDYCFITLRGNLLFLLFSPGMGCYPSPPVWMQWHSDCAVSLIYIHIEKYKSLYIYQTRSLWIRVAGIRLLYSISTLGLMEESIKMTDKFSVLTVFKEKLDILSHCVGSLFTSVI